jgi:4'-phosphopantetheinyl transferase EntD
VRDDEERHRFSRFEAEVNTRGYRTVWGGTEAFGVGSLLPGQVVAVEAAGAVVPDDLFPEEATIVANACEGRKTEFARARSCARRALAELHRPALALRKGPDREPVWPPGVVGSITHCDGYCCAAVALAEHCSGIGIDAEIVQDLSPDLERQILLDEEVEHVASLDRSLASAWACVIFSAKEALFKAWYPRTRHWLDFHDAAMRLDPGKGEFEAHLRIEDTTFGGARRSTFQGRFCIDGSRVLTALCIR